MVVSHVALPLGAAFAAGFSFLDLKRILGLFVRENAGIRKALPMVWRVQQSEPHSAQRSGAGTRTQR
jgi:hypothetical protein